MIMSKYTLGLNTILHTKDGRKIGNAIITGRESYYWEITTDYGNKIKLTSEEIDELFYIAWIDLIEEIDGSTCRDMQFIKSQDHKYRVYL